MHASYNFAAYTNFCRKDWWQKSDYVKIYQMKYFTNDSFPIYDTCTSLFSTHVDRF